MRPHSSHTLLPALLFLAASLSACSSNELPALAAPARPVTVLELIERVPQSGQLKTGTVEPYRTTQVGFEVGGRVTFVRDVGQEIDGPLMDGEGELLLDSTSQPRRVGDVIASLDDTRYRQAVKAVELKLTSMRRQLAAQQIELERVASADLASAQAQAKAANIEVASARESVVASQADLDLATSTVERNRGLVGSGAVSQSVVDQSEAELLRARARLEQAGSAVGAALQVELAANALASKAEGAIMLKEAQVETTYANIAELTNELDRARTDLESCVLRAPFSGRITEISASNGSFVQAGQSIANLVLMAPVKVVFTASAQQDRELRIGMGVRVYPQYGSALLVEEGIVGTIFEKGEVADPATRTFRVGIMVRNPLLSGDGRVGFGDEGAAPVTDIFPAISMTEDQAGPLFVNVDCLLEVDGEFFVLRLPELQLLEVDRDLASSHVPEKVRVELSDDWEQIDAWTLRRLESNGDLTTGQALVMDPTPERAKGLQLGSREWALRPGDIVRIGLEVGLPPSGLWVPVSAIREINGSTSVMLVEEARAHNVPISVHEASGELRRIEGERLSSGVKVVLSGVHYVADGDRIKIVKSGTR